MSDWIVEAHPEEYLVTWEDKEDPAVKSYWQAFYTGIGHEDDFEISGLVIEKLDNQRKPLSTIYIPPEVLIEIMRQACGARRIMDCKEPVTVLVESMIKHRTGKAGRRLAEGNAPYGGEY